MKNKFSFSPNQLKALNLAKQNMLVSAGAGSGKTAVLIERLYQLYTREKVQVNEVLVLVFGRLAAQELKERINKKLALDPEYAHLIPEVEVANIVTFDAYALEIVRKYGANFALPQNITNLDEVMQKVKFTEYFDIILESYYENPTSSFTHFITKFHARNTYSLLNFLLDFHNEVNLKLDEEEYLSNYIGAYYNDDKFSEYIRALLKKGKALLGEIITTSKRLTNDTYIAKFEPLYSEFAEINTFDALILLSQTVKKPVMPNKFLENHPENVEDETKLKALFGELKEKFAFPLEEVLYEDFLAEKSYATFVIEFYTKIRTKLQAFKNKFNAFTFSDISKLAYKIVQDPVIKKELQDEFQYILIDEYQDTSDIQEAFIQTISTNNVYMVGDIKQSIYGFRNANPELFKIKYRTYSDGKDGELVVLNDNYRSRPEVITPINDILSEVMTEEIGGANYRLEHQINAANTLYNASKVRESRFNYQTFYLEHEDKTLKYEAEVMITINDIKNKMRQGHEIYDFTAHAMRPVNYGDFTILLRDATRFDDIEKMFNAAGVPIFPHKDETIHDDQIMLALKSALVIYASYREEDAPTAYKFRHAVASFLRSFIVGYTDEKLYYLFNAENGFHEDPVLFKFQKIVNETTDAPVKIVIDKIVDTFKIYEKLYTLGDVYLNSSKLSAALSSLYTFSNYHYSLTEIITHFDDLIKTNSALQIKRTKLASDAVNMLTMHGSKGLEYPIVYYFLLDKGTGGQTSSFRVTTNHGFAFPTPYKYSLSYNLAKEAEEKKEQSEMIRLLYVALTRAKEEINVIAAFKRKKDGSINETPLLTNAKTMLDVLRNASSFTKLEKEIVRLPELTKDVRQEEVKEAKEKLLVKKIAPEFTVTKVTSEPLVAAEAILEVGTKFHRYLELFDFEARDFSFIKDAREQEIIRKVVSLNLFTAIKNNEVYREYNYLTAEGEEKIIDMFIKKSDVIILIDFKLRNIDPPEYVTQILTYKAYLEKTFNLSVKPYLISIITGEVRYIDDGK